MNEYKNHMFRNIANTKLGKDLWVFLNEDRIVARMEAASELSRPAVAGFEEPLLDRFGNDVVPDRVKQMIGHMTRQVMEANGYEMEKGNVTIGSALFSKGARYRRPRWQRLEVFRNSTNALELSFAGSREAESIPEPPTDGGKWRFWASFTSELQGCVVYGINVREVREEVATKGYALRPLKQL